MTGLAEDLVLVGALAQHLHGNFRMGSEDLEDILYRKNLIGLVHTTLFFMLISRLRTSNRWDCKYQDKPETPSSLR
ncbi:hypothetical protein D3C85_1677570 [compost metagenome]